MADESNSQPDEQVEASPGDGQDANAPAEATGQEGDDQANPLADAIATQKAQLLKELKARGWRTGEDGEDSADAPAPADEQGDSNDQPTAGTAQDADPPEPQASAEEAEPAEKALAEIRDTRKEELKEAGLGSFFTAQKEEMQKEPESTDESAEKDGDAEENAPPESAEATAESDAGENADQETTADPAGDAKPADNPLAAMLAAQKAELKDELADSDESAEQGEIAEEQPPAESAEVPAESDAGDDAAQEANTEPTADAEPVADAQPADNPLAAMLAAQKAELKDELADSDESAEQGDGSEAVEESEASAGEAEAEEPAGDAKAPANPLADMIASQKAKLTGKSKSAAASSEEATQEPKANSASGAAAAPAGAPIGDSRLARLPLVPILLVFNTALVVFLIVMLLTVLPRPREASSSTVRNAAGLDTIPLEPQEKSPSQKPGQAVAASWGSAAKAYSHGEHAVAAGLYAELVRTSRHDPDQARARDFYEFRIAQCRGRLGGDKDVRRLLAKVSSSWSPAVRAAANYNLALLDSAGGQHMEARRKAYLAVAALGEIKGPLPLEADCEFLIARELTRKVCSFHTTDDPVSWPELKYKDPFEGMSERSVRWLLAEGVLRPEASASPARVEIVAGGSSAGRWTVASVRAPLEEVLQQFSKRSGVDLDWKSAPKGARRQPVNFCLLSASAQRLNEVACGMTGLVARFDWDGVAVYDQRAMSVVSQQRDVLSKEAFSAWRRFLLRHSQDSRRAVAHFALAVIKEWSGDLLAALGEYQLVAKRFTRAPVAPKALMRCAKVHTRLSRHADARRDLLDLLDTYPNYPLSGEVHLYLGQVCEDAGQLDEAIAVYRKLYHLNYTPQSRLGACLGAGRCLYSQDKYRQAVKWLELYVSLSDGSGGEELAGVYYLVGKSQAALGDLPAAAALCRRALQEKLPDSRRAEILLTLARVEVDAGQHVRAITVIERIKHESLTEIQRHERILLESRSYRQVALPDKAVALLRKELTSFSDANLRAILSTRIARAYGDMGKWPDARRTLSEALDKIKPGPDAYLAACDLAEACLECDRPGEAVKVLQDLLKSRCPKNIRTRARRILSLAHVRCGQYQQAASVLSAQPSKPPARRGRDKQTGVKKP